MEKLDLVVVGILVAGGAYYIHSQSQQRQAVPPPATPAPAGSATPVAAPGSAARAQPEASAPGAPGANPHRDGLVLETPELRLELSTAGASVRSAVLKNVLESTYRPVQEGADDDREARPFELVRPLAPGRLASFATAPAGAAWTRERAATTDWAHEALPGGGHRFTLDVEGGLRLVKTFLPPPAPAEGGAPRYDVEVRLALENRSGQDLSAAYTFEGPAGMVDQSADKAVRGQQVAVGRRVSGRLAVETLGATSAVDPEKPDLTVALPPPEEDPAADLTFFGLETKYFAAVVLPQPAQLVRAEARGMIPVLEGRAPTSEEQKAVESRAHQALVAARSKEDVLRPGDRREHAYLLYLGPKRKAIFEDEAGPYAGRGLEKLIDFGWFEPLAKLLLLILKAFHWAFGNWGVSVILLTFLVRGLLAPLSLWSQKNMLRMQKLGPKLNELKEKYSKKDGTMTPEAQREFAAAQMGMFREHGVNPIGCVGPIFLQLPVFVGLWNALNYSFDLRRAGFALWIQDLSIPDVLFRLPFSLPFLGTNAFSVLPLVMVVMYYLQTALQPTPSDPRAAEQQKMMKFMLPIFGLFMYTMPSGLMIYFITSASWSMVESKLVKRHLERTEGAPPAAAVATA